MREVFTNAPLLKKARLEPPQVVRLFLEMREMGWQFYKVPLTESEARDILKARWPKG